MDVTDTIFVINLESRVDRRIAMQKQLERIGWRARFFPAVRPENAAGFPSIGARGCFMSHLAVLKTAQDENAGQVVIVEDDVDFVPDFAEQWRSSVAELETKKWSIFYPGHIIESLPLGLSCIPPNKGIRCTHFMVINGPAIAKFIGGLETILSRPAGHPMGGPMHVDGAYSTIRSQNPPLTTYAYFPVLGYQRPSRTDIGNLKWFDQIGVLTPVINLARKLKRRRK
jgi:hypothetical protein